MHPSAEQILRYFNHDHLSLKLQRVVKPFHALALQIASTLKGAEATVALRKLLESKDAAVRAAIDESDSNVEQGFPVL